MEYIVWWVSDGGGKQSGRRLSQVPGREEEGESRAGAVSWVGWRSEEVLGDVVARDGVNLYLCYSTLLPSV